MTRFIILCAKFLVTLLIALLFSSCRFDGNWQGIDGNGNVKTEQRNIKDAFTKIVAKRGVEVILEQSNTTNVEVEADENLLNHILTSVENGTLIITTDENINNYDALTVKVKMPVLETVEASSGASVTNKNTLTGSKLAVTSSSGSEVEINAEYDNLTADASSGSNQTLTGKALTFTATSSSGSNVNAESLLANNITANASSGSSLEVKPLLSLTASASSGASIDYQGTPKSVQKDETSGGSINAH